MIVGGLVCTLGSVICAAAPSVQVLVGARVVQGLGGGLAAVVARAVAVDLARGEQLAKVMSLLMALGGMAPMIAPIIGAGIITVGTWRHVFVALVGFGLLMTATAALVVPESLPSGRRHTGGVRELAAGLGAVLRLRPFVGWTVVGAMSGFAMMAYVADASYVLQEMKGLGPFAFAMFFASTALSQVLLSVLNARLVGRIAPETLVRSGLTMASVAATVIAVGVFWFDTPLVLTCSGFLVLMGARAFVFGNAAALGAGYALHSAGAASAAQGVTQAIAMAIAAPLASSGGTRSAAPMAIVMLVGVATAAVAYHVARRPPAGLLLADLG
jgi:DHA1 family bicyclomycin/chloramphenicol resistance-like MFS transporter